MARKKGAKVERTDAGTGQEACPTFVLRADRAGHLAALIAAQAAMPLMPTKDAGTLAAAIREFELWMDAQGE